MNWAKGYSAHWRVYEVDTRTWADGALLGEASAISVERDCTDEAPLLESGSVSLDVPIGDGFRERYLRLAMYAEQDGGAERVDIATLLFSSSNGETTRGHDELNLTGRSVLYPASTRQVLVGTYLPKGADAAEWVADMLREAIAAPVEVIGSFTMETNVVFERGSSYLECAWQVLNAAGYAIQIRGDGTVVIMPMPDEPVLMLDDAGASILHPGISFSADWSDIPNRFTAVEGSQIATAVNDDASSSTSTVSRGYVVDELDTSPMRVGGESLAQYATRMLMEASTVPDEKTYTREYWPDVYPFSLVRGSLASVNIVGDLRVVTQSLTCDKGIIVQEKAQRSVRMWE